MYVYVHCSLLSILLCFVLPLHQRLLPSLAHLCTVRMCLLVAQVIVTKEEVGWDLNELEEAAHLVAMEEGMGDTECSRNDTLLQVGGAVTHTEEGGAVTHTEEGGAVTHPEEGGAVIHPEEGGAVTHPEEGGAVTHTEDGGAVIHPEEGGAVTHTEEGGAVIHTEEGGAVTYSEEGGAVPLPEEGRAVTHSEEGGAVTLSEEGGVVTLPEETSSADVCLEEQSGVDLPTVTRSVFGSCLYEATASTLYSDWHSNRPESLSRFLAQSGFNRNYGSPFPCRVDAESSTGELLLTHTRE